MEVVELRKNAALVDISESAFSVPLLPISALVSDHGLALRVSVPRQVLLPIPAIRRPLPLPIHPSSSQIIPIWRGLDAYWGGIVLVVERLGSRSPDHRMPRSPDLCSPSPLAPTRIPKHLRAISQIIPDGPRPRALFAWMGRDWRRLQRHHPNPSQFGVGLAQKVLFGVAFSASILAITRFWQFWQSRLTPSPLAPTRILKHLHATSQIIPDWRGFWVFRLGASGQ
jgi:hypothetical protein